MSAWIVAMILGALLPAGFSLASSGNSPATNSSTSVLAPATALGVLAPVSGGCSTGYWKTHPTEWRGGYFPNRRLGTVFNSGCLSGLQDKTMLDALSFSGGSD